MTSITQHFRSLPAIGAYFILFSILCVLFAVAGQSYVPLIFPPAIWLVWVTTYNYRFTFVLMLASIPVSKEIRFVELGLGTDLPIEPIIVGLAVVTIFLMLTRPQRFDAGFLLHPVSLLLALHFIWICVSAIYSVEWFVSLKFTLAKAWYILSFFVLAGMLMKSEKDFRHFCNVVFYVLLFTVVVVMFRHAYYGFSFADVNKVMWPFYRNHVSYAAIMAILLPIIALSRYWYPKGSFQRWGITAFTLFFLVAIYLSYTRTAYIAIAIAAGAALIMHLKLIRPVLLVSLIALCCAITYISIENRYLEFAPDYTKTITHKSFDNLLEATYKGEDISTMERVYRWVAGAFMFQEYPLSGFGPNNFYPYYKAYTVRSFETYVSDNPEQSGIHSYYLMVLVEQGIPGFVIFMLLTLVPLVYAERIYHQSTNKNRKLAVLMVFTSLVVIDAYIIINDMLETDKVGSFYFLFLATLVRMDVLNRREKQNKEISTKNNNAVVR